MGNEAGLGSWVPEAGLSSWFPTLSPEKRRKDGARSQVAGWLRCGKVESGRICTLSGQWAVECVGPIEWRILLRMWGQVVMGAGALAVSALPMRAAEQITLRNGFEITCHHHAAANTKVRLYMGTTNDNYIEVARVDIASVEHLPDPPAPVPDPAPKVATSELPVANPAPPSDEKLSPADLNEMLVKAGHEHNVHMDLLASVVKAESGGNAHAVSRTGARGLMQLMPGTAADLCVADSFRPEQNVRGGSTYLDE